MNKTNDIAVLVLDLQEAFLQAVHGSESVIRRNEFIIAAAALLEIPLFFTAQVPEKLGNVAPRFLNFATRAPVFPKTGFSGLLAEGLPAALRNTGIRHLLLTGIETPICIYQTTLEATEHGFAVTLLADGLGARRPDDATWAIETLRQRENCFVLPSESVFYALLRDARHDKFRAFTQLVKKYA